MSSGASPFEVARSGAAGPWLRSARPCLPRVELRLSCLPNSKTRDFPDLSCIPASRSRVQVGVQVIMGPLAAALIPVPVPPGRHTTGPQLLVDNKRRPAVLMFCRHRLGPLRAHAPVFTLHFAGETPVGVWNWISGHTGGTGEGARCRRAQSARMCRSQAAGTATLAEPPAAKSASPKPRPFPAEVQVVGPR